MNNQKINNQFAKIEIVNRCLGVRAALHQTAQVFGVTPAEIEKSVLIGTGFESFDNLETVYVGALKKGDLVLNENPEQNAQNPNGAFNVVSMDGNLLVEQCYLVLREKAKNCVFCGATEQSEDIWTFCCGAAMKAVQEKGRIQDAEEARCPLCGKYSENSEVHPACHYEEEWISEQKASDVFDMDFTEPVVFEILSYSKNEI
jgi:hypothetical protein